MKKNVWILNHYATNQIKNNGGRHFWFSEALKNKEYNPVIFCANTIHNSDIEVDVENTKAKFKIDQNGNVPVVFIKAKSYKNNGLSRIQNMVSFYKNLVGSAQRVASEIGKPDIIVASSVHPLTLVAGIKIAKKLGIPCICEVRDLWPESIVAYGALKRSSPIAKILYQGEKWIYKRADSIVMTWEGGPDYIRDQGWDKQIDLNKVYHINNGVVLKDFDLNKTEYTIDDPDLDDQNYKNFIYTGSIRKVNNLGLIVDTAKVIQNKGIKDIRFIIYGAGDEEESLKQRCKDEKIANVIFKGKVEKKYVPNILSRSYANLLHNSSTSLDKYGQSQNKMFEYLAAGKCVIQTYTTGYSIVDKYESGISAKKQEVNQIASVIIDIAQDEDKAKAMGLNARKAAYEYDFEKLTNKLIDIIEKN